MTPQQDEAQRARELDEEREMFSGPLGPTPTEADDWDLQARWELQRRYRRGR